MSIEFGKLIEILKTYDINMLPKAIVFNFQFGYLNIWFNSDTNHYEFIIENKERNLKL